MINTNFQINTKTKSKIYIKRNHIIIQSQLNLENKHKTIITKSTWKTRIPEYRSFVHVRRGGVSQAFSFFATLKHNHKLKNYLL